MHLSGGGITCYFKGGMNGWDMINTACFLAQSDRQPSSIVRQHVKKMKRYSPSIQKRGQTLLADFIIMCISVRYPDAADHGCSH